MMFSFFKNFKNIAGFLDLLKKGKEVANAETWKNRTIAANALLAFIGAIVSVAKGFGYNLAIDDATLQGVAVGIVSLGGLFNAIMHVITSARVGLSPGGEGGTGQKPTADVGQSPAV